MFLQIASKLNKRHGRHFPGLPDRGKWDRVGIFIVYDSIKENRQDTDVRPAFPAIMSLIHRQWEDITKNSIRAGGHVSSDEGTCRNPAGVSMWKVGGRNAPAGRPQDPLEAGCLKLNCEKYFFLLPSP